MVSITIFVDGNLSTFESHEIADNLENDLDNLDFVYLAIIHVNPLESTDSKIEDSTLN